MNWRVKMTDASESWREQGENMGLNEETARVELYCDYRNKETWQQEADVENYSSLNKYLRNMINLGRVYRKEGTQGRQDADDRVQELEAQIETLQRELANQEPETIGPEVVDNALIETLLGEQYQTVEEILEQLTANENLQANLKKPVEDALYDLAGDGRAEYQEGWGWRLGGEQ